MILEHNILIQVVVVLIMNLDTEQSIYSNIITLVQRKKKMNLPKVSNYLDNEDREDGGLYDILMSDPPLREKLDKVFAYERNELEPCFLGFTSVYRHLSMIIPLHWTVLDIGCNAAIQSYYFRYHKRYIGIDISHPIEHRFSIGRSEHVFMDGKEYIDKIFKTLDFLDNIQPLFVISNYVPDMELNELIRKKFDDCYVFYPK